MTGIEDIVYFLNATYIMVLGEVTQRINWEEMKKRGDDKLRGSLIVDETSLVGSTSPKLICSRNTNVNRDYTSTLRKDERTVIIVP